MDNAELKQKILEVMSGPHLASLATLNEGRPWVRYVMTVGTEDLTLYVNTFAQSRKWPRSKPMPMSI